MARIKEIFIAAIVIFAFDTELFATTFFIEGNQTFGKTAGASVKRSGPGSTMNLIIGSSDDCGEMTCGVNIDVFRGNSNFEDEETGKDVTINIFSAVSVGMQFMYELDPNYFILGGANIGLANTGIEIGSKTSDERWKTPISGINIGTGRNVSDKISIFLKFQAIHFVTRTGHGTESIGLGDDQKALNFNLLGVSLGIRHSL